MATQKAFLFDLNGTMVDDMNYHAQAWHHVLNNLGASLDYEQVKAECYGKNHELVERIFPGRFTVEEKYIVALEKEKLYQTAFRGHLKLITGLDKFLQRARAAGVRTAIGTAAMKFNIDFVLDNLGIRPYFDVVISADDIARSKPDPEIYLTCAERLGVSPDECIVFEDSLKGVECAMRARMKAIVLTLMHSRSDFALYSNVIGYISDYTSPVVDRLVHS